MPLQDVAMVVQLSIHQFYNLQPDTVATQRAVGSLGIDTSTLATNVVRNLLPRRAMSEIVAAVSTLRQYHYSMTIPWEDRNHRLLPSVKYMDYTKGIRERRDRLDMAVAAVAANLAEYKRQAKLAAPNVYREELYPDERTFRDLFSVDLSFSTIANTDDFRIKHVDSAIDEVRKEIKDSHAKRLATAAKQHIMALNSEISALIETLNDPKARLYHSVVQKIIALADLGVSLEPECPEFGNFSTDVLTVLENTLHSTEQLRNNPIVRQLVAQQLSKIVKNIGDTHGLGQEKRTAHQSS